MSRRASSEDRGSPSPKRRRYNLRMTPSRRKYLLGGDDPTGRTSTLSDDKHRERNKALKNIDTPSKSLVVKHVNPMKEKNADEHYTSEYEQDDMVLRRGAKFIVVITFDRNIDEDDDKVVLQFAFGSRPQESKGSLIRIPLAFGGNGESTSITGTWKCKVTDQSNATVTCEVVSPANCGIGYYYLYVESRLLKQKDSLRRHVNEDKPFAIIICNPWCMDDEVYMEDQELREEYVLSETGKIWCGSWRSRGVDWNFGQEPCLDVALQLLDKDDLPIPGRSSVITILRCISAQSNSSDDSGVLMGRWTDEYPKNCTKPWEWNGSVKILEQYNKTGRSVRFGQCWVFSGVVTTLCRALGIPTRSVTNFQSAHDTDISVTIDFHFDEKNEPLEDLNDSVWNFHVWNESWLRRRDLPKGYDGWQAHDGTPQEASGGIMRCGPASVRAIKEGAVYLNYDAKFIFAEVNGDKCFWQVMDDGGYELIRVDEGAVGKYISTKAAGSEEREDLTHDYKYPEGSRDERRVAEYVNKNFSSRRYVTAEKSLGVEKVIMPDTLAGDDIEIKMVIKNFRDYRQFVTVTATFIHAFYTGVAGKKVREERYERELDALQEGDFVMKVSSEEYTKNTKCIGDFKLTVSVMDSSGRIKAVTQEVFDFKEPEIEIRMPDVLNQGKEAEAEVYFKNTTKLTLSDASINCEGAKLKVLDDERKVKNLKPGDELHEKFTILPKGYGGTAFVVGLSNDRLKGIKGRHIAYIERKRRN